jgi:alcohol dehydrogenase
VSLPAPLPSRYGAVAGAVRYGPGVSAEVGTVARDLGLTRVLLVTDPVLVGLGVVSPVEASLAAAGVGVRREADVAAEPHEADVARLTAKLDDVDGVVALGGGAVLDVAKAATMLAAHGGRMRDHVGPGSDGTPLLPLVAMPTTAGTGSEAQSFALVQHDDDHRKLACGDRWGIPRMSLLDPGLTATLPPGPTATSGMDAMVHALETAVSTAGDDASHARGQEAFGLLWNGLTGLQRRPTPELRAAMMRGAHLAGQAIEASMLGAAHAAANPLTARFGVAHGAAVALTVPHVVRLNEAAVGRTYARMAAGVGVTDLAGAVAALVASLGLPTRLRDLGVADDDLDALAADAATQWTGRFNPVPMDAAAFRALYADAL